MRPGAGGIYSRKVARAFYRLPSFAMKNTISPDQTKPSSASHEEKPEVWKRRSAEVGLIVAFWLFIVLVTVGQRATDPRGPQGLAWEELVITVLQFTLWGLLTPGIFWLSRRISLTRSDWPRRILLHLGIALIVAILAHLLHLVIFQILLPGMRRPFSPQRFLLGFRYLDELMVYFVILAAGFARDYFLQYRERQREAVQLRAQLAEARLAALRMQLNPHFLFNTLHAILPLVERDPPGVRRMIVRLSELLRYTLDDGDEPEVPLEQELRFLRSYLDIQQVRLGGRLEVHEEIEPEVLDALVPNLILQPLVENAIKHGVSQVEGTGRIEVRAWREREHLHLSVRDNGPGFTGDSMPGQGRGVGLRNTKARLEQLYGAAQHLVFRTAEDGGLLAQITLPYHTKADLRATTAIGATLVNDS